MTRDDVLLGFGLILASGSAVAAAISFQAWLGFLTAGMVTLVAAAIAGTDFD